MLDQISTEVYADLKNKMEKNMIEGNNNEAHWDNQLTW